MVPVTGAELFVLAIVIGVPVIGIFWYGFVLPFLDYIEPYLVSFEYSIRRRT